MPNALKKDAVKQMNQSWMTLSAVFACSTTTKLSLYSKFSKNLETWSMPKTDTHALSTERKHMMKTSEHLDDTTESCPCFQGTELPLESNLDV